MHASKHARKFSRMQLWRGSFIAGMSSYLRQHIRLWKPARKLTRARLPKVFAQTALCASYCGWLWP